MFRLIFLYNNTLQLCFFKKTSPNCQAVFVHRENAWVETCPSLRTYLKEAELPIDIPLKVIVSTTHAFA